MNMAQSAGGSSCKEQENGDASNGSERPLKKARFAWQVKGKYHLKNDANDTAKTSTESAEPVIAGSSGSGSTSNNIETEQEFESLSDYLLKRDLKNLHSVIADPDKSDHNPSTSVSTENLQYRPRYVSALGTTVTEGLLRPNKRKDALLSFPLLMELHYTEDQCIARWQARQMAKGFVDNTINRVLDSWDDEPVQPDDTRFLALDVADFVNNLPGDNSIENEGILMAISAHGIRNPGRHNNNCKNTEEVSEHTNIANRSPSPQRVSHPLPSDEESHEQLNNNNNQCDTDNSSNGLDLPWSYSDDQKNESNDTTPFSLFPDTSSLSYQLLNGNQQNSNATCDGGNSIIDNDFIDTAISIAIQSKGLTTFGTDYG